jgi:hypothetical protein
MNPSIKPRFAYKASIFAHGVKKHDYLKQIVFVSFITTHDDIQQNFALGFEVTHGKRPWFVKVRKIPEISICFPCKDSKPESQKRRLFVYVSCQNYTSQPS